MWHELLTSDQDKAFAFYSAVFGWQKRNEIPIGMATRYLIYGSDSTDFGSMFTTKDGKAAWFYYVQVDDIDAALERGKAKEAKLLNGPVSWTAAIGRSTRKHAAARVRSTGGKSKFARRDPSGPALSSFSRSNLPLKSPPARGLHGKMAKP